MANGRYRPRKEFKFWLYHDLADDVKLMEWIKFCKETRQFASVIKRGLRLMWSLGQGDTSVLFELFPTLGSQLIHVKDLPTPPDNDDLRNEIAELKQMIREQGRALPDTRDHFPLAIPAGTKPYTAPVAAVKAAAPASADEISSNFLAFIQ